MPETLDSLILLTSEMLKYSERERPSASELLEKYFKDYKADEKLYIDLFKVQLIKPVAKSKEEVEKQKA